MPINSKFGKKSYTEKAKLLNVTGNYWEIWE